MKVRRLHILFDQQYVAELNFDTEADKLSLKFDPNWMEQEFILSPAINFKTLASSQSIKRFLENLFPEGDAFDQLLEHFRIGKKNTYRIMDIIGKDTAGAFSFYSDEELKSKKEVTSQFREVGAAELEKRLDDRSQSGLIVWDGKIRLSIAGVQDKLPVTISKSGQFGFGEGKLASTHILKFQKDNVKTPHLVLNEYYHMVLAKKIGLKVAEVDFQRIGQHPCLVVERFDRKRVSEDKIDRLHIIDGCQALDVPGSFKYERNFGSERDVREIREGITFTQLFQFSLQCSTPATVQLSMVKWIIFNLLISNSDAHGKNISFFIDKAGIRLCPFYDLLNISIYPKIDDDIAMSIGDEFSPNEIKAYQLAELCREINISNRLFVNQFKTIIKTCEKVLGQDVLNSKKLDESEHEFMDSLQTSIQKKIEGYKKILDDVLQL